MVPGSARNWIAVNALQQSNLDKKMKTKNMTTLRIKKSSGRSPLRLGFLLIPLALACFALSPVAEAVTPAPDGAYPGFNTAEGLNALAPATPGVWNTAIGGYALSSSAPGGLGNTAVGLNSLRHNTTGRFNSALGVNSLLFNSIGSENVGIGYFALDFNTDGNHNTAVGFGASFANTGDNNTAVGWKALFHNTSGVENTVVGTLALANNQIGGANCAFGNLALASSTAGFAFSNAFGWRALQLNTTGQVNNAFGSTALFSNNNGSHNSAFGDRALISNVSGSFNTAIGDRAGESITGSGNVCIGQNVFGVGGLNDRTYIRNVLNTFQPLSAGVVGFVTIGPGGQLGNGSFSSQRYKDDIKPMDKASEQLYALKPVSFRFKQEFEPTHSQQYGLIAEEVEKVNPDLVIRNEQGEVQGVRYDSISNMLLNEFLKEHRKVEELKKDFHATVAQQQKEIQVLTAQLKEQAAQIQKVSAQLEVAKPAPQTVLNNQ